MRQQKEINIIENRALVNFEGRDFLGHIGIDSRIFKSLNDARISVGVVSQQAVENGVSVLVGQADADRAVECLDREFEEERKKGDVTDIYAVKDLAAVGLLTKNYSRILAELQRNQISPLLLNQVAATGQTDIVVASAQLEKTRNIVEAGIYGRPKKINLALVGHGNVGAELIEQIIGGSGDILTRKKIDLRIVAILNSKRAAFSKAGFGSGWQQEVATSTGESSIEGLIAFARDNQLENLVAVDNTASREVAVKYAMLAENGFDIVSSNKIFNTLPISEYQNFRELLAKSNKKYLYETNVGAGLPLIDTIKLLHLSGENITRIKGVFSGSLSYIFNNFSVRDEKFSTIVREAMQKGYTEPDPREDLSGNDVARKLLILARELDLINEFEDINIKNLVPNDLQNLEKTEFISRLEDLDGEFSKIKSAQEKGFVLRYVGDLHGDLQQEKGELDVQLVSVPATSALGQLKGSDSIFEIYTESYGVNPIVIMGAGAGAKVTARGVFGDILRLSETI